MIRWTLLALLLLGTVVCSNGETSSDRSAEAGHAQRPSAEPRSQYAPVPKQEMFAILIDAGLDPEERPARRVPRSIMEALPEEPLQHFMLSVDQEGLIAFEFDSIYDAQQMEARCTTGFRFKNWYFGGLVTVDLTNRMKSAFDT